MQCFMLWHPSLFIHHDEYDGQFWLDKLWVRACFCREPSSTMRTRAENIYGMLSVLHHQWAMFGCVLERVS